jgi:hypothetical protein
LAADTAFSEGNVGGMVLYTTAGINPYIIVESSDVGEFIYKVLKVFL